MNKKKKYNFKQPKMMSSRVESDMFIEFEKKFKYEYNLDLQDVMNMFVDQFVSGSLYISGSKFQTK